MKVWLATLALAAPLGVAHAQDGGIWVNPKEFKAAPPEVQLSAPPAPVSGEKRAIYAIASAIGGQLSYVVAKTSVGSNLEPYERTTLPIADYTLDAIVMRGIDRVVARRFPQSSASSCGSIRASSTAFRRKSASALRSSD